MGHDHDLKMNTLAQLAMVVVIAYTMLCVYAWLVGPRAIFPAPPPGYGEEDFPLRLPADDGSEIVALWREPSGERAPRRTILYAHGNAEDLADIRPVVEQFAARGFQVLAVDYPGYGLTEGKPSEDGCYLAVDAAYTYLTETRSIDPATIWLYGRSLGSGPTVDLATRETVGGLILDGAFTSTFRVVTKVKLLPWDVFDNLSKIEHVTCPVLSLHGAIDRTVPWSHAKALYARVRTPKIRLWPLEAGHNNLIEVAGERYWDTLKTFERLTQP